MIMDTREVHVDRQQDARGQVQNISGQIILYMSTLGGVTGQPMFFVHEICPDNYHPPMTNHPFSCFSGQTAGPNSALCPRTNSQLCSSTFQGRPVHLSVHVRTNSFVPPLICPRTDRQFCSCPLNSCVVDLVPAVLALRVLGG